MTRNGIIFATLRRLFLTAVLLSILALAPSRALASAMVERVGAATVTLQLAPDPPQTGREHAVVTVDGLSAQQLANTRLRFSSSMPAMAMSGASGTASPVAGKPNMWTFDVPMAMATGWAVTLRFDGGLSGTASYAFAVSGPAQAQPGDMAMVGGHEDAWRNAALALALLLALTLVAGFAMARAERTASAEKRSPQFGSPAIIGLAVSAVVVVVGIAVVQARYAPPSMDMQSMSDVRGSAPVPVTLAPVVSGHAGSQISAPGIIQAFYATDVAARVPGVVAKLSVYNGDRVRAGQVLGLLDEPELAHQATAAQMSAASDAAAAAAAEIEAHHHAPNGVAIASEDLRAKAEQARYWREELRRQELLLKNGAVSQQEYQGERAQAEAAFAAAEAARKQLEDAQAQVAMAQAHESEAMQRATASSATAKAQSVMAGYATVVAPDDGIVVRRLADPGTTVQAGTVLVRIGVTRRVRIQANVAQNDLAAIRVGAPMRATFADGSAIEARVTSMQPIADPTTHTALVEGIVDNSNGRLVPGTYASITFRRQVAGIAGAVEVPSIAIVGAGQDTAVWADVNGTAHRVAVHVRDDDGRTAVLTGDFKRGDRVVVEGAQDMEEGLPIAERRP